MPGPESFEKYSKEGAKAEGEKLKQKVEEGEAEGYEEAEIELGREIFQKKSDVVEELAESRHNVTSELTWAALRASSDSIRHRDFPEKWPDSWDPGDIKLDQAIASLPPQEALEEIENFVNNFDEAVHRHASSNSREDNADQASYNIRSHLANTFVDLHLTPATIDDFFSSSLDQHASPERILTTIAENDPSSELMKDLLDKYDQVDLTDMNLFGENAILNSLNSQEQLDYLDSITDELLQKMEEELESNKEEYQNASRGEKRYTVRGLYDIESLEAAMQHLENAAEVGIIPSEYEEKLDRLGYLIRNIDSKSYSGTVKRGYSESLEDLGARIEQLAGDLPEGIEGSGLEFEQSSYQGATKVYLDGELVGGFVNPQFGSNPTNGEVVAWKISETIGRDTIKGTQLSDKVYVWRKGWDQPEQVHEEHAWSDESQSSVSAPEVQSDGTVSVQVDDNEKTFSVE